jgi:hypothetical protein
MMDRLRIISIGLIRPYRWLKAMDLSPSRPLPLISTQLAEPPQSAQQQPIDLPGGPALEIRLDYGGEQLLTIWLDTQNNLILKADLNSPTDQLTLIARSLEPLADPHPDLFK